MWALGARASVVVALGLSSCGAQALLLRGMWDLPGPGLEPMSPALAGGFLTTVPPGKSHIGLFCPSYDSYPASPDCHYHHALFALLPTGTGSLK